MTPKRFYYVMIGINALLIILVLSGVFFGNQLLKQQSSKLRAIKTQTKVIDEQQISLTQAKKDIEKYTELNTISRSIVPQDKDQAKTVREISKIAEESGITLKVINFQSSNLGQTVIAPPVVEGEAPKVPAAPPISQIKPVDGIPGLFALEIIISPEAKTPIPYRDFLTFLEKLENNRRTAHVDKIIINPTTDGSALTFTLTLNSYVKP